jgi:hypothetical protein
VLNNSLDEPPMTTAKRATQRTHHTRGNGRLEPEGISDGNDELPDAQRTLRGQSRIRKRCRLSTEYSEISRRIATHDNGWNAPAIDECNASILNALHNMLIGQHIAVRSDDDTGPGAATGARRLAGSADVNAHHCGTDMLNRADDGLRISIECLIVVIYIREDIRESIRPGYGIVLVQHRRRGMGPTAKVLKPPHPYGYGA